MSDTSAIVPYSTITLEATTEGGVGTFTDIPSIQAESVRVYNSGAVDVFVSFGVSSGEVASASVKGSFPIAPHESEVLYKGAGSDQINSVTAGGKSLVRVTAVKMQKSGGDLMSSLDLVSVLKDAMGNQKAIDAAAAKIASANAISNQKRQEAEDAAQTIADAKVAVVNLGKAITEHDEDVSRHLDNVARFNAYIDEQQTAIDVAREDAERESKNYLALMDKAKSDADARHKLADTREVKVTERERAVSDGEAALARDKAAHEAEKQVLTDAKAAHEDNVAKLAARKKKLDDAAKED